MGIGHAGLLHRDERHTVEELDHQDQVRGSVQPEEDQAQGGKGYGCQVELVRLEPADQAVAEEEDGIFEEGARRKAKPIGEILTPSWVISGKR